MTADFPFESLCREWAIRLTGRPSVTGSSIRPSTSSNGRRVRLNIAVSIGAPTVAPWVVIPPWSKSPPTRPVSCSAQSTIGTPGSAGSKLFCLSGHVERPGVYEVEFGAPLGEHGVEVRVRRHRPPEDPQRAVEPQRIGIHDRDQLSHVRVRSGHGRREHLDAAGAAAHHGEASPVVAGARRIH